MNTPLYAYLKACGEIRHSGNATSETSYYPALKTLFDAIGTRLDPPVKAVMNIRNLGAGLPDGGLFTAIQLTRGSNDRKEAMIPARGAVEAKGPQRTIDWLFEEEQTKIYSKRYGQVVLTNFREFALVIDDSQGRRIVDTVTIATSEKSWWESVARPNQVVAEIAERLEDFLLRALTHGAPLREASDIATLLASFAREAKLRMPASDPPGLRTIRSALEASLGLKFEEAEGDRFFQSTLIQTLFYGVFSAWVLWCKDAKRKKTDAFQWRQSAWHLRVPMVRSLFEQVATPAMLGPLRLIPILDAVQDALARVDEAVFFNTFDTGHSVQHFYEPFLRKFDPELRKKMGVWFTPPEVVDYMVARVDYVLRTEMDLPDGLADPNVFVLDPCVGTGSFLVSALRLIAERLDVTNDASAALKVKQIALERMYGFELIPAPYVVAHLQIGLLLQSLGVPLVERNGIDERAQIFLSNALTGWKTTKSESIPFPQFEEERDAANKIKRDSPVLVVLGNPPYDGFAGVSPMEEAGLLDQYKAGLRAWGMTKNKLDDPYIRFFRIAQNRVAKHVPHRGIVCFVSNYSWIRHKTAVPVRESLLQDFDKFWIDDLHGNRRISEYGPDGRSSETIFAMAGYSPGIKQGVVVSLWLKRAENHVKQPVVLYRADFNASKAVDRRAQMLASLQDPSPNANYTSFTPEREHFFAFMPAAVTQEYRTWPTIVELAKSTPGLGLNENRKGALIDFDHKVISTRIKAYFGTATIAQLKSMGAGGIAVNAPRFDAKKVRTRLRSIETFAEENVRRFIFRPFDVRWAYIAGYKLWNEGRSELINRSAVKTKFIMFRLDAIKPNDGVGLLIVDSLCDQHAMHKDAYLLPMHVAIADDGLHVKMFDSTSPNLSEGALRYLRCLRYIDKQIDGDIGENLWYHCLAIAHASSYQRVSADDLTIRPPRFPLPKLQAVFEKSAALGRRLSDLNNIDVPVLGLTSGKIDISFSSVARLVKVDGRPLTEDDLKVTVAWGRRSKNGVNGGKGKIVAWKGVEILAEDDDAKLERVEGEVVLDVYLSESVFWSGVPREVWNYSVAGYQVLKKWLSYRTSAVMLRNLSVDEARQFTEIARRIAAILQMSYSLDQNFEQCKAETFVFDASLNDLPISAVN